MYIWQHPNWTEFTYHQARLTPLLQQVLANQQQLLGKTADLPEELDRQAQMDALIQNALKTSEIEGELLNVGSVRSSVARHLGLEQAGFTAANKDLATVQTDSLIKLLTQVTTNLDDPLTQVALCQWQSSLFPHLPLLRQIKIGELRDETPMQVVSQRGGRVTVHFEAPPKAELSQQLARFITWFNTAKKGGQTAGDSIIRAALAHLWFITLHPFEDGNGRVARALTDRALAQSEQSCIRFYSLSSAIEQNRKGYYYILESTQSVKTTSQTASGQVNDVTDWLIWFLNVFNQALEQGLRRIDRVVGKTRFWQQHSQTVLNQRQVKVLNRLLDSQGEEFESGINARLYQSIAAVSKATATRDLADLVDKHCVIQLAGGGRSTRYAINTGQIARI